MNVIIKYKWLVLLVWIVINASLFILAPNMAELVREKGQITVPEGYSSTLAREIMKDAQRQEGSDDETQVVLLFHNEKKLTPMEIAAAEQAISQLEEQKKELGITEIVTHFEEESLKSELVSEDGKAILTLITLRWNEREEADIRDELYAAIADVELPHYFTSEWLIQDDIMTSAEEGLKKTEGITVVFILAVLLLVFRSFIAPIVPLLTVGFTYLASQSIVSILVDQADFPISSYTQIFLVVILFGLGTDYCILLFSRFKEELTTQESVPEAVKETYRHAGRTVFFSGLAVLIGFATIGFSQFILYQSAVAVAIGIATLLLAMFTLVPFFMLVFGQKTFWPSKLKAASDVESKLWGRIGTFSLSRPFISLLIVAAVSIPFLILYDGDLSYDSVEEISRDVHSVKAFHAIASSFGPGESMPTQIVVKNDVRMDSADYIGLLEEMSRELEKVDLVDKVRSVTRPAGDPIEDFLVAKQAERLEEGLGEGKTGLDKISEGLEEAGSELSKSEPDIHEAVEGVRLLVTGTAELQTGLTELQTNLANIERGIREGSSGANEMIAGLQAMKEGAEELEIGYRQLLHGYTEVQESVHQLQIHYTEIGDGLAHLTGGIIQTNESLTQYLEATHSDLVSDGNYLELKGTMVALHERLQELSGALHELNAGLAQVSHGMMEANEGFTEALEGQLELVEGLQQFIAGIEAQQAGLNQLADGQGQINSHFPDVIEGLGEISAGQEQLLAGFSELEEQLTELTEGLNESAKGLDQVSEGLGSAQDYLARLSASDLSGGFYLPNDVLTSKEFGEVLDMYMSKDRKMVTMDVIFEANPYSNEAMAKVTDLTDAVARATKDTKLENAVVAVGGVTSTNADLHSMSAEDFTRTVVFMLVGIAMILIFLFRSLIMPLYIIGSLILTYYTSMAITEVIFVNGLGYTGISWAVPFFGFVILVSLGVDYSIFLMDRFQEYNELPIHEAMIMAMRKMGTVILSAVVILGGTFAAMMPSGMLSLLEIATIVIIGLFLYACLVLPLFIPVMVKNFGEANWWPFQRPSN